MKAMLRKRVLTVLVAIAAALSLTVALAGCGSSEPANTTQEKTTDTQKATDDKTTDDKTTDKQATNDQSTDKTNTQEPNGTETAGEVDKATAPTEIASLPEISSGPIVVLDEAIATYEDTGFSYDFAYVYDDNGNLTNQKIQAMAPGNSVQLNVSFEQEYNADNLVDTITYTNGAFKSDPNVLSGTTTFTESNGGYVMSSDFSLTDPDSLVANQENLTKFSNKRTYDANGYVTANEQTSTFTDDDDAETDVNVFSDSFDTNGKITEIKNGDDKFTFKFDDDPSAVSYITFTDDEGKAYKFEINYDENGMPSQVNDESGKFSMTFSYSTIDNPNAFARADAIVLPYSILGHEMMNYEIESNGMVERD